jgi:hypothetical protein
LNVVSKCGRYVETRKSSTRCRNPWCKYSVFTGWIRCIIALLIKGRFDQTTAQYFRSLQRNNSAFDSQSLQNVRITAELSSVSKPNTTASYSSTCKGQP